MGASTIPPFRADHVGSLLRPAGVKLARQQFYEKQSIGFESLTSAEDLAIADLVKLQESAGLQVVTDGEARRSFWHYDFMGSLDGFALEDRSEGVAFAGVQLRPVFPIVHSKVGFPSDHPMLGHYKYLAKQTKVTPKISIPGPSCCHFRVDPTDIAPPEYSDVEHYTSDLAAAYKKAVAAFYNAGCRYLQMDDIFFAYLCDPKHRAFKKELGQDPDWLIQRYAWMMNEAIKDRPSDMTIGMHMCRGNFRSTHAAEGSYDAVADAVFNQTGVDVFFMEYDTDRAGGLEPLKFLSKGGQRVMAGFITTKTGALESMDQLKRQFDEASRYADMDQLGITPQCGFASTEEGNSITEDDQKRKLELVVQCAEQLW